MNVVKVIHFEKYLRRRCLQVVYMNRPCSRFPSSQDCSNNYLNGRLQSFGFDAPWAVKKATQYLLQHLHGFRIMSNQVSEKQPSIRKPQSFQPAPEDEELKQGIDITDSQAPEK